MKIIKRFLWVLIIGAILLLVFLSLFYYAHRINSAFRAWMLKAELELESGYKSKVLPNTSWVEQKVPIYVVNGKNLSIINIDGTGFKTVFQGEGPASYKKEFSTIDTSLSYLIFSPNRKYLFFWYRAPTEGLYKLDRETNQAELFDTLEKPTAKNQEIGYGSARMTHPRWSPDSQKILYIKYKRTLYVWNSELDDLYLFDFTTKEKTLLAEDFDRSFDILFWDFEGNNIYFTQLTAKDGNFEKVKVYQISLKTKKPELIAESNLGELEYFGKKLREKVDSLLIPFGIKAFRDEGAGFGAGWRPSRGKSLTSKKGTKIGLDYNDNFYYEDKSGVKNLFKLPRDLDGYSALRGVRWVPGAKYVIMSYLGWIVILEPATGKMGELTKGGEGSYEWYER